MNYYKIIQITNKKKLYPLLSLKLSFSQKDNQNKEQSKFKLPRNFDK